jgi:phage regulator Rha-like protein
MSKSIVVNDAVSMDSREIAELTGKEHKNVLADVRNMLIELNIEPAEFSAGYLAGNGQTRECFNLPKRECLILVSGYNLKMRATIIDRWQELEGNNKPMTTMDMVIASAQAIQEQGRKLEAIKGSIDSIEQRMDDTVDAQDMLNEQFLLGENTTIKAYCSIHRIPVNKRKAQQLGRECVAECRKRGVDVEKHHDHEYGVINKYPVHVVEDMVNNWIRSKL